MSYITRNAKGEICGLFSDQQFEGQEFVEGAVINVTPTVVQQLAALDAANELTQRNLRESIMLMTQAFKELNPGLDLMQIPGIAKVFEVEAQATALRAQL